MRQDEELIAEKPNDWPQNGREALLDRIWDAVEKFISDPGYKTRENLVSLVSNYDLNQRSSCGLCRVTDYEVAIINSLYMQATALMMPSLKILLYELVGESTRSQKMLSYMFPERPLDIEEFGYLIDSLKFYYIVYQKFTVLKNRAFADQIIAVVNDILAVDSTPETIWMVTHCYVTMLNDISNFQSKRKNGIWAFTRDELLKLFSLEARLLKMNNDSALVRPTKGLLMMTISNYVLKSRNNYNDDYICKYVSESVAGVSADNHQLWIQEIEYLNDKREEKLLPEIFSSKKWLSVEWAKNIEFAPVRNYYVSSFCKSIDDPEMKKRYGQCVYGYKNDRIADLISPIRMVCHKTENKFRPAFSQVVAFDVLYDMEKAKDEINYLCAIINEFNLSDSEKGQFLQDLLQYWLLSVKDKKWSYERERRYVIFLYDTYTYAEIDVSDKRFLKLKTTALLLPDFILGNNPSKEKIEKMIAQKERKLSTKSCKFCKNCLSRDYDAFQEERCPICGSNYLK